MNSSIQLTRRFRLTELLLNLNIPYDLFIADAGLLGRCDQRHFAAGVRFLAAYESGIPAEPLCNVAAEMGTWTKRWQLIAEGAQRIVVPCPQAEAFAASVLPHPIIKKIERAYETGRPAMRKRQMAPARHLGFVPVRSCAHEQRLMRDTARQLNTIRPDISITVIGEALDDIGLMHASNAFVTGVVEPREFQHLIVALGIERLFITTTQPLFGHPTLSAASSSQLPTAYFDWSMGKSMRRKKDLAIDPCVSLAELIRALNRWIPETHPRAG